MPCKTDKIETNNLFVNVEKYLTPLCTETDVVEGVLPNQHPATSVSDRENWNYDVECVMSDLLLGAIGAGLRQSNQARNRSFATNHRTKPHAVLTNL